MDGSQVSFGRRGVSRNHVTPVSAGTGHVRADVGPYPVHKIAPNVTVERSIAKLMMFVALIWLVVFLTAGHTKYGNDLPFWMRPASQFSLGNYLFPLGFCSMITLLTLGPAIRRPIALKLFDDHFEFLPLVGRPRTVRWSTVGEITQSRWDTYKTIHVAVAGERRVAIPTNHLGRSRDEIASLLEYARSHAGFRQMHLSGEPIDSRYMFPGH